jgi:hypothetical protein
MGIWVPWLADAARATGYRVVEVPDWRSRGHGPMRRVEGVVGHHTATSASAGGDYPSLGIVTNGRSDLPGPLCNLGLGRAGTIYVVAAGTAWHAGGSRWTGFTDLNDEFLGIEAESPGRGEWTSAQRDCYPRLVGALLRYMSRGAERYGGHKDVCLPPGRKIDPVGIDTAWMQTTARPYIAGGGPAPVQTRIIGGDEVASIKDYDPCPRGGDGSLVTRKHVYTLPVGRNSGVTAAAWLSFKCGAGEDGPGAEYVRLMSIRGDDQKSLPGGNYPVDKEWKEVPADHTRVYIDAADGQDSFAAYVRSQHPYSITIEIKPK